MHFFSCSIPVKLHRITALLSIGIVAGCTSPEEVEQHLLGHWQQVEQNTTVCITFMKDGLARRTTREVNLTHSAVSAGSNEEAEKTADLQEVPQSEDKSEDATLTYEDGFWGSGDGKRYTMRMSIAFTPEGYYIPNEGRRQSTSEFIINSELGGDSFSAVNARFQSSKVYNFKRVEGCSFPEIPEYANVSSEPE